MICPLLTLLIFLPQSHNSFNTSECHQVHSEFIVMVLNLGWFYPTTTTIITLSMYDNMWSHFLWSHCEMLVACNREWPVMLLNILMYIGKSSAKSYLAGHSATFEKPWLRDTCCSLCPGFLLWTHLCTPKILHAVALIANVYVFRDG